MIVHFRLHGASGTHAELQSIFTLENQLEAAIDNAQVGEYDGNDVGGGEANLYAYGPDANALFRVMSPYLRSAKLRPTYALLRFGPADDTGTRQRRVTF